MIPGGRCIAFLCVITIATLPLGSITDAQTRSVRDTATAYGARLNAKGEPANLNPNRINNRLDRRLSLRVERYRPQNTNDPATAFDVQPTDNARVGTATTLSSSSPALLTPDALSSPISSGRGDDDMRQR